MELEEQRRPAGAGIWGWGLAETRGEEDVQCLEILALHCLALPFQAFLQASRSKSPINAVSWVFFFLCMILARTSAGHRGYPVAAVAAECLVTGALVTWSCTSLWGRKAVLVVRPAGAGMWHSCLPECPGQCGTCWAHPSTGGASVPCDPLGAAVPGSLVGVGAGGAAPSPLGRAGNGMKGMEGAVWTRVLAEPTWAVSHLCLCHPVHAARIIKIIIHVSVT